MRPKRLFITHDRWDGNLKDDAATVGIYVTTGLAAADVFCNYAANGAGLGGVSGHLVATTLIRRKAW